MSARGGAASPERDCGALAEELFDTQALLQGLDARLMQLENEGDLDDFHSCMLRRQVSVIDARVAAVCNQLFEWGGPPVHGLPATSVRELLHQMACLMVSMDYKRRHEPDAPVGQACGPWMASCAAQAKALLWAARDLEDIPLSMPVPPPLVVSEDDCRARYLALYGDGELAQALDEPLRTMSFDPERRAALAKAAFRLFDDLTRAGVVRDVQGAAT